MPHIKNPILHLGVDIGYRRDTSAVAAFYRNPETNKHVLFCHRIWEPPVHIPAVTDYVRMILKAERVATVNFDPHQWAAESQKLTEEGYGREMREITQTGSFMIGIGTNLSIMLQRDDVVLYRDPEIYNHFSVCAVRSTESGPRIVKSAQAKPIDVVIAIAMALWSSTQDIAHTVHPAFDEATHTVDLMELV
jgi:phage terminase large subunit-like protein